MKSQMQLAEEAITRIRSMKKNELRAALISSGLATIPLSAKVIPLRTRNIPFTQPKRQAIRSDAIVRVSRSRELNGKRALSIAF